MKPIEKQISSFIESQFPAFYREEGPQFVAFVKAYYEWMEQSNNALFQARSLPDYRDIDTTVDDFIIHFKEKYLKNIQFDTATNKQLLVKHALDLYRSKGTERSIDLFFKLVYGTNAEVKYPADNMFRLSDGLWEVPEYLEISYSAYNVDYVGKQIIGSISGAKGFVEKYIRRRTEMGYVNLLYISDIVGEFYNGEVIGINVNNTPVYDSTKRATLIGSVRRVELETRGQGFSIGDIVTFGDSPRGVGGQARVSATSNATGIVDFLFYDGGYGYTLSAESLISEKVLGLSDTTANATSTSLFHIFEPLVQPLANLTISSSTANLNVGDSVYRYSGGNLVTSLRVVEVDNNVGTVTVGHVNGAIINSATYYTTSNVSSFYANTIENRTIAGKVMGIPSQYTLSLTNINGSFEVGQQVRQKNTSVVYGSGTIVDISNNILTIDTTTGTFKPTSLTNDYIEVTSNTSTYANIVNIETSVGVYEIRKYIHNIQYSSANNNTILDTAYIYQYDISNRVTAKGQVVTASYSAGSGNISFIPLSGYFKDTQVFYTDSNSAIGTVVVRTASNTGGDYIDSPHTRLIATLSNTTAFPTFISYGSGADFNVGTLGDTEVIFIGTDLLGSNNVGTLDIRRKNISVASNTGFAIGDYVYQTVNRIGFNANSSVNASTGFITLPSANTLFLAGDVVQYEVASGNTTLNNMVSNNFYYVKTSNSTGVTLAYPYRKTVTLNTSNYPEFANNKVNEVGHYLFKRVYGTVFEVGSGLLRVKDAFYDFAPTGGVGNTSQAANSNIIKYTATTTNTSISSISSYTTVTQSNTPYMSLSLRAPAYGFPKNPVGYARDTIYSCLTFGRFEIGTIGSLSGINPGSEYNVDPYVLAYQPYISAFNRKNFIITISNPTSNFIVGERVNQTLPSLIYYDLKVTSGVYSNTYAEVSRPFNTQIDVVSASDFIYVASNTITFNSNTDVSSANDTITISGNPYLSNTLVRYYTSTGNTALSGLANNTLYYVAFSNGSAITLSTTEGGANINITGAATGEAGHNIRSYVSPYIDGQKVLYTTPTGNTALSGLTNNTPYFVVSSNTVGFKVSTTLGGSNVDITANSTGGEQHYFATIPGYLPNDRVYQDVSGTIANATVVSVYTSNTGDQFVRVTSNTNPLTNNYILYSYTNPYVNGNVTNVASVSVTSTARGIVQSGSNNSVLYVKRLTFENTFKEGTQIVGVSSSATANVVGVSVNDAEVYPIGLNANIAANVVTANGQVADLQVVDSGFGYTNSEIISFYSSSGERAGSIKVILDGNGIGKGYYRSSKGFLSDDMYLQDSDYYQEYSYEILSKISFDRYKDMFKKVMHTSGTKFFGSALIVEEANASMTLTDSSSSPEISFNALGDVDSATERVKLNIEKYTRSFNPVSHVNQASEFITLSTNPFIDGDIILYYTDSGNTVLNGLANNSFYYTVQSNSSGVKLATTANGTPLDLNTASAVFENGHNLRNFENPFSNNDQVLYYTDTGNTAISGLSNNGLYYVVNCLPISVQLASSANGTPINITAGGSSQAGHYLLKVS